jgi:uncharacterized protein YjiS (DUF1127 family)
MIRMLSGKISEWLHCRDASRRLHGLDDRLLADMGTLREDIECFVQGCRSVGYEDPNEADWQLQIRQRNKPSHPTGGMLTSGL